MLKRFLSTKAAVKTLRSFSKEYPLAGKKVLIRTDFNVPLSKDGIITDDTRIRAALPTIDFLRQHQAKVVICSHLGRPKGKVVESMRLLPVARRLSELLPTTQVTSCDDCIGVKRQEAIEALNPGDCLLLENVRFHPEEEKNDPAFAKELAQGMDVYVNDAFGTAHRAHASTEGVTKYIQHAVAGQLMEKELNYLANAVDYPKRPLIAVIGGAKVSTKLPVLTALLEKCDKILLGGGMIFTFYKAMGYSVGDSIVEENQVAFAKSLLEKSQDKLIFPTDIVIADAFDANASAKTIQQGEAIPDGWLGLDIGPNTINLFEKELRKSSTIVWNGPMGVFEFAQFATGTIRIAEILADCTENGATTIIGGGDSVAAVTQANLSSKISHISTGGGASLELLEGRTLPGVFALTK